MIISSLLVLLLIPNGVGDSQKAESSFKKRCRKTNVGEISRGELATRKAVFVEGTLRVSMRPLSTEEANLALPNTLTEWAERKRERIQSVELIVGEKNSETLLVQVNDLPDHYLQYIDDHAIVRVYAEPIADGKSHSLSARVIETPLGKNVKFRAQAIPPGVVRVGAKQTYMINGEVENGSPASIDSMLLLVRASHNYTSVVGYCDIRIESLKSRTSASFSRPMKYFNEDTKSGTTHLTLTFDPIIYDGPAPAEWPGFIPPNAGE